VTPRARLFIFSGREDPAWNLAPEDLDRLQALWNELPEAPSAERAEVPGRLGYRGVEVDEGDRHWIAVEGRVTCTSGGVSKTRRDPDRTFERLITTFAPEGAVPPGVLPESW
jgi:hypothetical protein